MGILQLKDSMVDSWVQGQNSLRGKNIFDQFFASSFYMGNLAADLERENRELKNQLRALKAPSPAPGNEVTQLQEKVSSPANPMTLLEKDLQHHRQMLGVKEEEKKTLELQIQSLSSQLSVEVAQKNKAISNVVLRSSIQEQFQTSVSRSPDSAQELASQNFEILQLQERLKAQDSKIDFLTKELEHLKTEKASFQEKAKRLESKL
ncbi:tropomyosin-like [Zingiber officinale]|uniref:tropomyosin-like n=1 Tax=Zingiber officinale TaxID=94328 RepID=UPI001C4C523E|nr:tropomyosin-like [Zingiber officinale]